MEDLSPNARIAAQLFAGNSSLLNKEKGVARALASLSVRAGEARKRVASRYFQGESELHRHRRKFRVHGFAPGVIGG